MRHEGDRRRRSSVRDPRHAARHLALAVLGALLWPAIASAVDLAPLLAMPGTTVTLSATTDYTINGYQLSSDKTLLCNGAHVTVTTDPIAIAGAGTQLVVDDCVLDGSGWAVLAATDGAAMVVRNGTRITGNGTNTGIYLVGATLDVDGGSIAECQVGVLAENSDAAHHGVVFTHTLWGVQSWAATVTLDGGCQLTNLDPTTPGSGVDLRPSPKYPARPAVGVIRDTAFTGFGNVVGTQPAADQGLPWATAEITDCTFDTPAVSAVIAVDANVHFARSRVTNAVHDGLYFQNSIALVEDSEILNSQNTGVSFYGCPNGGMIRGSRVSGSVHQGVTVGIDPDAKRQSHGVRVVDNTLTDNVIANLLVDASCDAVVQGNVFSGAPDMSIRVHGGTASLVAGLELDSQSGLEVKDGAHVDGALSVFTGHPGSTWLAYGNAGATFSHCDFESAATVPDYAMVVSSGAQVTLGRSSVGPAGTAALYNRAGNTATATFDYWGDPSGPKLLGRGGGSGAIVLWKRGSHVTTEPFLATPPVESRVERAFQLVADAPVTWAPDLDVTLALTGASGMGAVPPGLVAALRVRDASTLTASAPPVGTFDDGVVAVWIAFDVLSHVQSGTLRLRTAGAGDAATVSRLDPDGQWVTVPTTWDGAAGEIVYAPADPRMLHGVFAIGDGTGDARCATARDCLAPLLAASPCADPMDARVQKAIGRKLGAAMAKLAKAATGVSTSKLVRQARRALQSVEALAAKAAHGKISTQCRDAIDGALEPVLQRLDSGAI